MCPTTLSHTLFLFYYPEREKNGKKLYSSGVKVKITEVVCFNRFETNSNRKHLTASVPQQNLEI